MSAEWNQREDRWHNRAHKPQRMADGALVWWFPQTPLEWDGVKCQTTLVLRERPDGTITCGHGRVWSMQEENGA